MAAFPLGILVLAELPPKVFQVLVGPTYFTVPIETQKGFVEAVNCALVKGSGGGVPFDLIHWQTGKRVAQWNGYRLDVD